MEIFFSINEISNQFSIHEREVVWLQKTWLWIPPFQGIKSTLQDRMLSLDKVWISVIKELTDGNHFYLLKTSFFNICL